MAVKLKLLFNGDLTSTVGGNPNVLDSGTGLRPGWLIRNICIYNANASGSVTVSVFVTTGSTSAYLVKGFSLAAAATPIYIEEEISLNHPATTPDSITVFCSNSTNSLQCVVCGIERDQ
jgi:hypothetical protein